MRTFLSSDNYFNLYIISLCLEYLEQIDIYRVLFCYYCYCYIHIYTLNYDGVIICLGENRPKVFQKVRSNRPSSDKIHGTVITSYIGGTSEKFKCIGNRFNFRIIFKSKPTLRGALMKTGPVRDAQQTKQCVYSIPCDCGICYIGEESRPLEVCIKEHKYNLTQGLLKIKISQYATAATSLFLS
jgi:hypothetical protein